MLQAVLLEQPIPTNDPDSEELRMAQHIADGALFDAMEPAEQRVTIARDVLLWLKASKLIPSPGSYLRVYDRERMTEDGYRQVADVDDVVNGYECRACALGGLFACAVERGGAGGTLRQFHDYHSAEGTERRFYNPLGEGSSIRERLAPYFKDHQLGLIECAFEGAGAPRAARYLIDETDMEACLEFAAKSSTPSARMRAIMKNIIANDGTFIP